MVRTRSSASPRGDPWVTMEPITSPARPRGASPWPPRRLRGRAFAGTTGRGGGCLRRARPLDQARRAHDGLGRRRRRRRAEAVSADPSLDARLARADRVACPAGAPRLPAEDLHLGPVRQGRERRRALGVGQRRAPRRPARAADEHPPSYREDGAAATGARGRLREEWALRNGHDASLAAASRRAPAARRPFEREAVASVRGEETAEPTSDKNGR